MPRISHRGQLEELYLRHVTRISVQTSIYPVSSHPDVSRFWSASRNHACVRLFRGRELRLTALMIYNAYPGDWNDNIASGLGYTVLSLTPVRAIDYYHIRIVLHSQDYQGHRGESYTGSIDSCLHYTLLDDEPMPVLFRMPFRSVPNRPFATYERNLLVYSTCLADRPIHPTDVLPGETVLIEFTEWISLDGDGRERYLQIERMMRLV